MSTEYNLLKYRFYSTVVGDILKAVDGGSLGGAFILSFCCIDYLGQPIALKGGKLKSGRTEYKDFVRSYMGKVNPQYQTLGDKFYAVRCSLVHTYGESDATELLNFTPQFLPNYIAAEHLTFNSTQNKFYLVLSWLIADLIVALELFFHQELTDDNLLQKWGQMLYYPQGLGAFMWNSRIRSGEAINYSLIHPFLAILDTETDLELIRDEIQVQVQLKIDQTM